ncbi:MAG: protein kinase, partial [Bryobacteraceae bacterium]
MSSTGKLRSRYELKEVISKGGMGVIYKAHDTLMKREVALKTILDIRSPSAAEMFRKEWALQASVIHPNVVEIYDIGDFEEDGVSKPYFVMPLLPGLTLGQLIRSSSHRLTVERCIDIICQTCRGLQAAHEKGLIHRDLKPSNIFVMDDDSVKIIDFGIVHSEDGAATDGMKGTLPYMAPELLQMKQPSTVTDIFALGAVSYEALTLRRAFQGATDAETSKAILYSNPPPASEINKSVSQMIGRVVHKAMAKQPWHRYSTPREFGDTLAKALRNEPIEFFDPAKVAPRVERASRAFERGEYQVAAEMLSELEGEGHIDQEITHLRRQIEQATRQVNIRQLLESSRRFFEEEEYSLALRKIQEALQLDPNDSSALALKGEVETKRREKKIDEWSQLARRHLDNNAFPHARSAIQSLLELKANDTSALEMMAEIDRREQDFDRVRGEKSALYDTAVDAWQRGDVTAALSRLERWALLTQNAPDTDGARLLSCQNFYNQVRSEHEAIKNSYDEARKQLADGNFAV